MKPRTYSIKHFAARGAVVLFILSLLLPGLFWQIEPVAAAAPCAGDGRCIYLPMLAVSRLATGDLTITTVEVTQGIQNPANSIPLIAGRSAMLRIYAIGQDALPAGASNVSVSITATPPGPGLSLAPLTHSAVLPVAPSRSNYASTINVPIPAAWLTGNYDLSVTIDPENLIAESNESNNTFVQPMAFANVPVMRVKIVPIVYTHTPDGRTYPAPTVDSISTWIMRLYPVSNVEITWHAPYAFTGNMVEVNSFSTLLSQMSKLKNEEGAPADQVYYALVPTIEGFSGGVVGIGYIGHRVSVGLNYSNAGQTAAHEIGHNLGRYHAPCGDKISSPDPAYPYDKGKIGEYGLDLTTGTLYSPDSYDFMSYCQNKWVSDYTYRALMNAQLTTAAAASLTAAADVQPAPVLNVRALVSLTETRLLPVYRADGAPSLPDPESAYRVQLLGAGGQVLVDLPVKPLEISSDEPLFEIQASLALPDAPVQTVRILKAGQLLAESALNASPAASGEQLTLAAAQDEPVTVTGETLRWPQTDRPAVVRYSLDGGQTWTTLAMDVTGGQLDLSASGLPANALFDVIPAFSN